VSDRESVVVTKFDVTVLEGLNILHASAVTEEEREEVESAIRDWMTSRGILSR